MKGRAQTQAKLPPVPSIVCRECRIPLVRGERLAGVCTDCELIGEGELGLSEELERLAREYRDRERLGGGDGKA